MKRVEEGFCRSGFLFGLGFLEHELPYIWASQMEFGMLCIVLVVVGVSSRKLTWNAI